MVLIPNRKTYHLQTMVNTTNVKWKSPSKDAQYIKEHTMNKADKSLWHQHWNDSKRHQTTPVANLMKSLLYRKQFTTGATRWDYHMREKAKKCYVEDLRGEGHPNVTIKLSGL